MVLVNYSGKEINAKVVYYGPGLCGKTTNLEFIYGRVPQTNRGKMVSMKTRTERTLFFDFLPLNLGELAGFQTRFLLYTVPGQIYYNATRKLVLKGVDALVFVADSARGKMDENLESFENLRENLREHGINLDDIPLVLQWNKRDLPETYTEDEMQQALNPDGKWQAFSAVATTGDGVFETFKGVARQLLAHLSKSMGVQAQGADESPTAGGAPVEPARPETPSTEPAPAEPMMAEPMTAEPAVPVASTPLEPAPVEPVREEPVTAELEAQPEAEPEAPAASTSENPAPVAESGPRSEPPPLVTGQGVAFAPPPAFERTPAPMGRPDVPMGGRLQPSADPVRPIGSVQPLVPTPRLQVGPSDGGTASTTDRRVVKVPLSITADELRDGVILELHLEIEAESGEDLRRAG